MEDKMCNCEYAYLKFYLPLDAECIGQHGEWFVSPVIYQCVLCGLGVVIKNLLTINDRCFEIHCDDSYNFTITNSLSETVETITIDGKEYTVDIEHLDDTYGTYVRNMNITHYSPTNLSYKYRGKRFNLTPAVQIKPAKNK